MPDDKPKTPRKKAPRPLRFGLWYLLLAFLLLLMLVSLFQGLGAEEIKYSEFKKLLRAGKVESM